MTPKTLVGYTSSSSSAISIITPKTKSVTTLSSVSSSSLSLANSICTQQTEYLLSSNGKESSVTLDLLPPHRQQMNPCKRTFRAPESYRFIVKLLKFKSKQMRNPNSHIDSKTGGVSVDIYNETATCPLNIVSIWRQHTH